MNTTTQARTQECTHPKCHNEAVVWYRWTDWDGRQFEMTCNEHAVLIRKNVMQFDGRGQMHNGIAEGAGK